MQYFKRICAVFMIFVFVFLSVGRIKASADGLSISAISATAYSMAKSFGINFVFTDGTANGAKNYLERKINSYLQGRSISEVFGDQVIRDVAGKLIIPGTLFNAVKDFLENFVQNEGLSIDNTLELQKACLENMPIGSLIDNSSDNVLFLTFYPSSPLKTTGGTWAFWDGEEIWRNTSGFSGSPTKSLEITGIQINGVNVYGQINFTYVVTTTYSSGTTRTDSYSGYFKPSDYGKENEFPGNQIEGFLSSDYGIPTILDPTEGYWEGDFGLDPDTNLDELLDHIFDETADNNLVVDGEIIEPGPAPTPVPTPIPVNPDTPLQDVPWEGLNDLLGQTEESINEQIQSQTQSVTSAQEATTEAVESLTDTITSALDMPGSKELPDFKFDLRELFPFCIPFDIYRLLSSFDAEPQAPHVQLPIVIQSIGFSYNLDLDFSSWNPVAQAMRTAELIVYAIGLAWATGKVIKW